MQWADQTARLAQPASRWVSLQNGWTMLCLRYSALAIVYIIPTVIVVGSGTG